MMRLGTPDLLIVAVYLVGITLFGIHFRRLAAGARRSRRGVRILPLLCPRSMRAARLTRSQAAHYHRATFR